MIKLNGGKVSKNLLLQSVRYKIVLNLPRMWLRCVVRRPARYCGTVGRGTAPLATAACTGNDEEYLVGARTSLCVLLHAWFGCAVCDAMTVPAVVGAEPTGGSRPHRPHSSASAMDRFVHNPAPDGCPEQRRQAGGRRLGRVPAAGVCGGSVPQGRVCDNTCRRAGGGVRRAAGRRGGVAGPGGAPGAGAVLRVALQPDRRQRRGVGACAGGV